ncbi:hypothetical protein [Vibrio owensii]|uniref:hypothetical protein n=1 Tax=Vibrio owensii TaxID=696485 RepID=UPI0018F16039|nr:hypothetical protein [Vibrio owensii]
MQNLMDKVKWQPLERHEYNELANTLESVSALKPQQRMRKGEHYFELFLDDNDAYHLAKSIKHFNRTLKCPFVVKHFDALFPFDDVKATQPHHKGLLLLEYAKFLRYVSKLEYSSPRYSKALISLKQALPYLSGGYKKQAMCQITLCLIELERYEAARDWAKKSNCMGAALNSIKSQIGLKMQDLSKYKRKRIRKAFSDVQLPTDEMLLPKEQRLYKGVQAIQQLDHSLYDAGGIDRLDGEIAKIAERFALNALELSDEFDEAIEMELIEENCRISALTQNMTPALA